MKVSIFTNGKFCTGIDYSNKKECINVIEITELEFKILKNGGAIENGKIIKTEKNTENEKQKEVDKIEEEFKQAMRIIKNGYSQEEIDTFHIQLEEAKKVLGGGESEFINEMLYDGYTATTLSEKIMEKANALKHASALALKTKKQKLYDLENNI